MAACCGQHFIEQSLIQGGRLLAENVLSCGQSFYAEIRVAVGMGGNVHGIDLRCEKLIEGLACLGNAVLSREGLCAPRVAPPHGVERSACNGFEALRESRRGAARAHYSPADELHVLAHLRNPLGREDDPFHTNEWMPRLNHSRDGGSAEDKKRAMDSGVKSGLDQAGLPLATLLSQVLVAFTIEFDNEFEHRAPHWTTVGGRGSGARLGPWLTSMAMWSNLMRLVPEEGATVGELCKRLRMVKLPLKGMQRWGYIRVAPDPKDPRAGLRKADWMIWSTAKGRMAQQVWRPLAGIVEERWLERFGKDEIATLRKSLLKLVGLIGLSLPEFMPIVGYGLFSEIPKDLARSLEDEDAADAPLSALLSKALLAFTLEFESEGVISLPVYANVMRILEVACIRLGELPRLSGVSKEGIHMALTFLKARGFAVVEPAPSGARGQVARLTPKGKAAKAAHRQLLQTIEERWKRRFGAEMIGDVRAGLEKLVGVQGPSSPLFEAIKPYPRGWRASIPMSEILPHCPMVLHRGGYPDGS